MRLLGDGLRLTGRLAALFAVLAPGVPASAQEASATDDAFEIVCPGPPNGGDALILRGPSDTLALRSEDIGFAGVQYDAFGSPAVFVALCGDAAAAFEALTAAAIGRPVEILVAGEVLSAPVVQAPIAGGRILISGGFTEAEAADLARALVGL